MATKKSAKETSVAFIGRRPKNFGGYKLDWSGVESTIDKLLAAFHDQGYDRIYSDGCQGVGMIAMERACWAHEHVSEDIRPSLILPIRGMCDKWSPSAKDKFGQPAWHKMKSRVCAIANASWWSKWNPVRYVNKGENLSASEVIRAYHATHEQLVDHSAIVVAVWPSECGDWNLYTKSFNRKNSGTAATIKRAIKKRVPVNLIITETISGSVVVKESRMLDLNAKV